jgi:hypothetical protein
VIALLVTLVVVCVLALRIVAVRRRRAIAVPIAPRVACAECRPGDPGQCRECRGGIFKRCHVCASTGLCPYCSPQLTGLHARALGAMNATGLEWMRRRR